jgi:hypothetical protein
MLTSTARVLRPVSNYFDLTANLSSIVAVLLGLRAWPAVDTIIGYIPLLLLPFALTWLGFDRRERIALMLALAVALYTVHAAETVGTMLHVKAWGGVYAFVVLLSIALKRPITGIHKGLLFVLPLTGPTAAMLFIVFAMVAVPLRPRQSYEFLIWAAPGLIVQITSALQTGQEFGFAARPYSIVSVAYGADLLLRKGVGSLFVTRVVSGLDVPNAPKLLYSCLILLAIIAIALRIYMQTPERRDFILLLPVQILHFFASTLFALGGTVSLYNPGTYRYFFPAICMGLMYLVSIKIADRHAFRFLLSIIVGVILLINHNATRVFDTFFFTLDEPSWQSQVRAHESNPTKPLAIYPLHWSVILPDCGMHYCRK